MKAIQLIEYVQTPSDLRLSDLSDPSPSKDEYVIRIHAAAVNFFDLLQIRGKYQHQPPFPWIAGAEFSGTVLHPPSSRTANAKFKAGDRVFGSAQGAFATHITCPESSCLPVPPGWDFTSAAGLMVTAPTAYAALVTRAGVKEGEWVLIHAAAGGVGLAAVQVAKALGAKVVACVGSESKGLVAKRFGADKVVNYRDTTWWEEVKGFTPSRRGVNAVIDPVGMVEGSLKCTAWGGRIVIVGFAGGRIESIRMNKVLLKDISVLGLHWGTYAKESPEIVARVWRELFLLIESGDFRPTVYKDRDLVGLGSVCDALSSMERRETWGKVVIGVPQKESSKL